MIIGEVETATLNGLEACHTLVQASVSSSSAPQFLVVGLGDNAVKESRERVRLALHNSGAPIRMPSRIVVNLTPSDLRKEGAGYDLPVAVALLKCQYPSDGFRLDGYLFWGELSLKGDLLPSRGILNLALHARETGCRGLVLPRENAPEAAVVPDLEIIPITHLSELIGFLSGQADLPILQEQACSQTLPPLQSVDLSEIHGQAFGKRALEIAAAGGHNLLMAGPPGSGKTLLATALPGILPRLTRDESLEVSRIYSCAGLLPPGFGLLGQRPFRQPHHTISEAGLVGGGSTPQPGEISLSHMGVLFLDELQLFKPSVLECLRQPLESGEIRIARARQSTLFPARFQLVAAMNRLSDSYGGAVPGHRRVQPFSRPFLDRLDIQVEIPRLPLTSLVEAAREESSATVAERVLSAHKVQKKRWPQEPVRYLNAHVTSRQLKAIVCLDQEDQHFLTRMVESLGLSTRAYYRILRIARTLADLEGSVRVSRSHLMEAVQFRQMDLNQP